MRKILVVFVAALTGALPWAAWSAVPPGYGGTLIRPFVGQISTFDPQDAYTIEEREIARHLFSRLTRIGVDGEVELDLAETMEILEDGLVYRFRIREGATFQDGSPVMAADVRYSLERLLSPAVPASARWILVPVQGSSIDRQGIMPAVAGIRLRNLETVEILLDRPVPLFPEMLATLEASIMPRLPAGRPPEEGERAQRPMGSGPFMLARQAGGSTRIFLHPFSRYYKGKPYLGSLVYVPYNDVRSLLLSVTYRGASVTGFPFRDIDEASLGERSVSVLEAPGSYLTFVAIGDGIDNADRAGLAELLRRGIDTRSIIDVILNGRAARADRYLTGERVGQAVPSRLDTGPEGAGAPLPDLSGQDLERRELVLAFPAFYPDLRLVAERIQVNLAGVGVSVKILPKDRDAFVAMSRSGHYDLLLTRVASSNRVVDFLAFYHEWIAPLSPSQIAGASETPQERAVLGAMEQAVDRAARVVFLYREPRTFLVRTVIRGLAFGGDGYPLFDGCWLPP